MGSEALVEKDMTLAETMKGQVLKLEHYLILSNLNLKWRSRGFMQQKIVTTFMFLS
jgi:hypothetical protein